jgi:hypothetical protein
MQSKKPRSANGQAHGKWEVYFTNGKLWFIDYNVNGAILGYSVGYGLNSTIKKEYYAR